MFAHLRRRSPWEIAGIPRESGPGPVYAVSTARPSSSSPRGSAPLPSCAGLRGASWRTWPSAGGPGPAVAEGLVWLAYVGASGAVVPEARSAAGHAGLSQEPWYQRRRRLPPSPRGGTHRALRIADDTVACPDSACKGPRGFLRGGASRDEAPRRAVVGWSCRGISGTCDALHRPLRRVASGLPGRPMDGGSHAFAISIIRTRKQTYAGRKRRDLDTG